MKRFLYFLLISILFISSTSISKTLKVSEDGRYLQYSDGTPFFYLGDTAWELFHRLNREEADLYLTDRANKGFTVIQGVVLSQVNGMKEPNPYGDFPLKDQDPSQPLEGYFKHVDYIVNKAEELGLYIGMLPTWGSYWTESGDSKIFDKDNAYSFGQYLGKRYKDKPIIWILGGDTNPHTQTEIDIIESMALGLKKGDGGAHLITFHPRGPGLSSDYFHNADWLDFNMVQSSHGAHDHDNGLFAEHDYALTPPKPTLDGEPRYETMPTGFYFKNMDPKDRIDDFDSRQAAYWSLLAGACGHTYGNNNIWQMWTKDREGAIFPNVPWNEAIHHPGSFQMGHLAKLYNSIPFETLVPAQDFILDGPTYGGAKIRAAVAADGSIALIYSPYGEKFTVDKSRISGDRNHEVWWDPRYGTFAEVHRPDTKGIQSFTPPTNGRGNDWLLIIYDDALKLELK